MSYQKEREQLCNICHLLFERKLVAGADGNVSMRLDDDSMLITPSGICKGFLEPEQLLVQQFDGKVREGNLCSTKEAFLHIAYYTARTEVCAVVHTHPPYVTAFAATGQSIPLNVIIELPLLIGKTPVADYAIPGSTALVDAVKQHINSDTLLLKNHGVITLGNDINSAFVRMDALENAAKTVAMAQLMGNICKIPANTV